MVTIEPLITTREEIQRASEAGVRIHPSSLRRWLDQGLVPEARRTPGGRWRVPRGIVDRLVVAQQLTEGAPEGA